MKTTLGKLFDEHPGTYYDINKLKKLYPHENDNRIYKACKGLSKRPDYEIRLIYDPVKGKYISHYGKRL